MISDYEGLIAIPQIGHKKAAIALNAYHGYDLGKNIMKDGNKVSILICDLEYM